MVMQGLRERIVDAALRGSGWNEVLHDAAREACGVGATLTTLPWTTSIVSSPGLARMNQIYFSENWIENDPRLPFFLSAIRQRSADVITDAAVPSSGFRGTPSHRFFTDVLPRSGTGDFAAKCIWGGGEFGMMFTVLKAAGSTYYDPEQLARFDEVADLISVGVQIADRMDRSKGERSAFSVLDSAGLGAFGVLAGRIEALNSVALELLGDGLELENGGFRVWSRSSEAAVRRLVETARDRDAPCPTTVARVHRPSGRQDLIVRLIPNVSSPGGQLHEMFRRSVDRLIIVVDPERRQLSRAAESAFRGLGLTATEAQVAACIGAGLTAHAAAEETGLTVATVRTYMRNVYSKLGISRQSQLALLCVDLSWFPPLERGAA